MSPETMENSGDSRRDSGRFGVGTRRVARELALQMLFQNDFGSFEPDITAHTFEACFSPQTDEEQSLDLEPEDFSRAWPLACELFFGTTSHQMELDEDISRASANWTLSRMSAVDRGLIRLAYYEMSHRDDIPAKVSLNEALEIAKVFGDEDSGSFINGVLDRLMRSEIGRAHV